MNISGARLHLSARGMLRDAAREKERYYRERGSATANGKRQAATARSLLCIGAPCPGELSTRNDPREAEEDADSPRAVDFYLFHPSSSLLLSFSHLPMMILISGYGSIVYEYLTITNLFPRVPVGARARALVPTATA